MRCMPRLHLDHRPNVHGRRAGWLLRRLATLPPVLRVRCGEDSVRRELAATLATLAPAPLMRSRAAAAAATAATASTTRLPLLGGAAGVLRSRHYDVAGHASETVKLTTARAQHEPRPSSPHSEEQPACACIHVRVCVCYVVRKYTCVLASSPHSEQQPVLYACVYACVRACMRARAHARPPSPAARE